MVRSSDVGEEDRTVTTSPTPPSSLPQYIVQGLQRQDVQSLKAVVVYVDTLQQYDTDPPIATESPPDRLPQYLIDGLHRQDGDALQAVMEYAEDLIKHQTGIPSREDIRADLTDGAIEEIQPADDGTYVIKKNTCGRDECSACPHGPYVYYVTYSNGSIDWEYRGPLREIEADL